MEKMIEPGNNGNGFQFRSDAGAKIYERIMKTSTGNRLARCGARNYASNFDVTHRIKEEMDGICDAMLVKEGETLADNYTLMESAIVYMEGKTGLFGGAAEWADERTKGRLRGRKKKEVNGRLEGLVGHCSKLTSNCDAVLSEIDERLESVTRDFYNGLDKAKSLKTVVDEYDSRIPELGEEIQNCGDKDYRKKLALERELSGLSRDHSSVVTELDQTNFQVQICERELQELDNTSGYMIAVRANNAQSEQRFRLLLAQAKRKQYNLSPMVIDAEKLVEGDQLAKDQARLDTMYSRVMGKMVELIAATFGTPMPPSNESMKEFRKKRREDVGRVKKDFDGLIDLEQARLSRMLEP